MATLQISAQGFCCQRLRAESLAGNIGGVSGSLTCGRPRPAYTNFASDLGQSLLPADILPEISAREKCAIDFDQRFRPALFLQGASAHLDFARCGPLKLCQALRPETSARWRFAGGLGPGPRAA